jgi:hypothetical protein
MRLRGSELGSAKDHALSYARHPRLYVAGTGWVGESRQSHGRRDASGMTTAPMPEACIALLFLSVSLSVDNRVALMCIDATERGG